MSVILLIGTISPPLAPVVGGPKSIHVDHWQRLQLVVVEIVVFVVDVGDVLVDGVVVGDVDVVGDVVGVVVVGVVDVGVVVIVVVGVIVVVVGVDVVVSVEVGGQGPGSTSQQ